MSEGERKEGKQKEKVKGKVKVDGQVTYCKATVRMQKTFVLQASQSSRRRRRFPRFFAHFSRFQSSFLVSYSISSSPYFASFPTSYSFSCSPTFSSCSSSASSHDFPSASFPSFLHSSFGHFSSATVWQCRGGVVNILAFCELRQAWEGGKQAQVHPSGQTILPRLVCQ